MNIDYINTNTNTNTNNNNNNNNNNNVFVSSPPRKRETKIILSKFESVLNPQLVPTHTRGDVTNKPRKYSKIELYNAACNNQNKIDIDGINKLDRNYYNSFATSVEIVELMIECCDERMYISSQIRTY